MRLRRKRARITECGFITFFDTDDDGHLSLKKAYMLSHPDMLFGPFNGLTVRIQAPRDEKGQPVLAPWDPVPGTKAKPVWPGRSGG